MVAQGGDIANAITIEPKIEVDWQTLGMVVAERPSPDQARFLLGFIDALHPMDPAYIAAEYWSDPDRSLVAFGLRVLAETIEKRS